MDSKYSQYVLNQICTPESGILQQTNNKWSFQRLQITGLQTSQQFQSREEAITHLVGLLEQGYGKQSSADVRRVS